jgi:hypothetical protein
MDKSESIASLSAALAKAQGQIEGAKKDSNNSHFKAQYADLASVWDACRKALSANGLAVVQIPGRSGEDVTVTTTLTHSSGEWISGIVYARPMKADAQGIGSVITYLRRYSLAAMVGVAPEDDDGNAASGRDDKPVQRVSPAAPPSATTPDNPGSVELIATLVQHVNECHTLGELNHYVKVNTGELQKLAEEAPTAIQGLREAIATRKRELAELERSAA